MGEDFEAVAMQIAGDIFDSHFFGKDRVEMHAARIKALLQIAAVEGMVSYQHRIKVKIQALATTAQPEGGSSDG